MEWWVKRTLLVTDELSSSSDPNPTGVSIGAIFGQRLPGPANSQMVAIVTSKCPWLILVTNIMGGQCRSPDINEIMHFLLLLL